jgi:hypothetical protein
MADNLVLCFLELPDVGMLVWGELGVGESQSSMSTPLSRSLSQGCPTVRHSPWEPSPGRDRSLKGVESTKWDCGTHS